MADKKITELTEVTTISDNDLFAVVTDTGTTPTTKKIKKSNIIPNVGIYGLKMIRVSDTAMTVSTGFTSLSDGTVINVSTAIAKTSLSLTANTWYHVYLYLNSGTPDIEIVTTAPASPYYGTARAKTGDTSRRYVGSVLSGATNKLTYWLHNTQTGLIAYTQEQDRTPYRVIEDGKAITETNVSCSAVVPITSQLITIKLSNVDTTDILYIGNSEDGVTLAGDAGIYGINPLNYPVVIGFPLDSSQSFSYIYSSTPTTGLYADVYGYYYER